MNKMKDINYSHYIENIEKVRDKIHNTINENSPDSLIFEKIKTIIANNEIQKEVRN
jgi:hypothetical protein